jgi:hydroxyacylglutathione hydrolase
MLTIEPIPAFNDNYIWLLSDPGSSEAFVVDPGDAAPVFATLEARNLTLTGILITHHHFDHTGGLEALSAACNPLVF